MARGLRHGDPRCGREHYDRRAEWEPSPNGTEGSIPDVPWSEYCSSRDAPRTLFAKGDWRVTSVGLELVSDVQARYQRYEVRADQLLDMYDRGFVYRWPVLVANEPWANLDDFELAFRQAIEIFHRRRSAAPVTTDWWIDYRLAQQTPDSEILDRTFRRVRAIRQKKRSR